MMINSHVLFVVFWFWVNWLSLLTNNSLSKNISVTFSLFLKEGWGRRWAVECRGRETTAEKRERKSHIYFCCFFAGSSVLSPAKPLVTCVRGLTVISKRRVLNSFCLTAELGHQPFQDWNWNISPFWVLGLLAFGLELRPLASRVLWPSDLDWN